MFLLWLFAFQFIGTVFVKIFITMTSYLVLFIAIFWANCEIEHHGVTRSSCRNYSIQFVIDRKTHTNTHRECMRERGREISREEGREGEWDKERREGESMNINMI